jgi:DNA-directed RNA polymerase subunit F
LILLSEKPITEQILTIPQVKKLLESLGEENLSQFQRRTLDFASKFSKVDAGAAQKLIGKLVEEFDVGEEEAVQIVNCMPESIEEVKVFLGGGRRIIGASKLEAIVKLLDDHRRSK